MNKQIIKCLACGTILTLGAVEGTYLSSYRLKCEKMKIEEHIEVPNFSQLTVRSFTAIKVSSVVTQTSVGVILKEDIKNDGKI